MGSSTWDDVADTGFSAENVSKHDGPDTGGDGGDDTCRICHQDGHYARECPDKPEGGGGGGACFNCGEDGHIRSECPNASTEPCKICHGVGHTKEECEANRVHLMFADMGIEEMSSEDAWAKLEAADKDKDIDDIKLATYTYVLAMPGLTIEELEMAFRTKKMNTYLIGKQQEVSDTHTIVNFQGQPDQEFVLSFQFSAKPKRVKFAEGWPADVAENTERLSKSGIVMDGFILKCRNCDQIGHLSNACEEEKDETRGKIVANCSNCEEPGHMARDCTAPRKVNRNGCKNCGSFEHFNKDCTEERSAEGVECKNCGETGHFSKDCPSRVEQVCFNCQQPGHRKPDCPNDRVIKCKNCDGLGHMSRECDKPTDWSRVQCNNCKEMGHTIKRCKNPAKVEEEDDGGFGDAGGYDGGNGGFDDPAPATGGGGGGGGGGWEDEAPAATGGGWATEETPAASGW